MDNFYVSLRPTKHAIIFPMRMSYTTFRQQGFGTTRSKYNNKKTIYNGVEYQSKKEAKYAEGLDLALLEKGPGRLLKWERQIRYPIIINEMKVCDYILDFRLYYKDRIEYVDVKGMKKGPAYAMFRLKSKLMKAVYNIDITEV